MYISAVMDTWKDVKDAVRWAREVHSLGMKIIAAHPRRAVSHSMAIPMMMTGRALNALDSVMLLVQAGHTVDAFSIMRSVCELAIDLGYMAKSDTEARMELFANHIFVSRHQFMKALDDAGLPNPQPAFAAKMASIHQRIEGDYDKPNWAGKSIAKRADESGKKTFYNFMFRLGSGASHSCAESLWWESSETTVGGHDTIVSRVGDYSKPEAAPLQLATLALFDILMTVAELLGLDFGQGFVDVMASAPTAHREAFLAEIAAIQETPSETHRF